MGRPSKDQSLISRLAIVVLVGAVACSSSAPEPPKASPSTATFDIGPPPANCQPGPDPREVNPQFAAAVGQDPIWAVGPGKGGLLLVDLSLPPTPHGQPVKVLWVVRPGFRGLIRLSALETESGTRAWFKIGDEVETAAPMLDPEHPAIPLEGNGPYPQFPSSLIFSRSGCYSLQARWPGGGWTVPIVVGRQ